MPRTPATNDRLNSSHPLFTGISNLWLPLKPIAGGRQVWDLWSGNHGILTNAPTWKQTQFGPGVETGVAAANAYVDLNNIQLSRNLSIFVAFRQRYDASGAGAESGILYGAGTNGFSFRLGGTTIELLKSHIASILSVGVTVNNGEWHTAGFTVTSAGTATFTLYFDGLSVVTATSATTFTGTGITTFGYDDNATNPEYGRHTILAGALWNGRVLTADDAQRWHDAARQGFKPLLKKRSVWTGAASTAVSAPLPPLLKALPMTPNWGGLWLRNLRPTPMPLQTPPGTPTSPPTPQVLPGERRPGFLPSRLLGLSRPPVTPMPLTAPPQLDSAFVQKYPPAARLSFGPSRLIGLTGVRPTPTPPNNPTVAPARQVLPPPVGVFLPNLGGFWLRHLQPTPTPGPPAPAIPGPPSISGVQAKPFLQRVPKLDDERRLARHTELLSSMFNAAVGKGQIQQTGPTDWKIIGGGFEAGRPPGAADDSTIGATPGCTWIDTTAGQGYVCISNGTGSAVWQAVGGSGGGGSGLTGTFS